MKQNKLILNELKQVVTSYLIYLYYFIIIIIIFLLQ
jgi:hypothetical protein